MSLKKQDFTINIEQINEEIRNCESNCNEIMFINKGATTALIEKFPLAQNEFIVFGGNRDEYCTKNFNVQAPAGSGLYAIRKNYV